MPFIGLIISWLTTHAVRLAVVGAFSMLLGVGIYMQGQNTAAAKCAAVSSDAFRKEVLSRNENREKIRKMPSSAIDRALDEFLRSAD